MSTLVRPDSTSEDLTSLEEVLALEGDAENEVNCEVFLAGLDKPCGKPAEYRMDWVCSVCPGSGRLFVCGWHNSHHEGAEIVHTGCGGLINIVNLVKI